MLSDGSRLFLVVEDRDKMEIGEDIKAKLAKA